MVNISIYLSQLFLNIIYIYILILTLVLGRELRTQKMKNIISIFFFFLKSEKTKVKFVEYQNLTLFT